jgi:hypothetical protein
MQRLTAMLRRVREGFAELSVSKSSPVLSTGVCRATEISSLPRSAMGLGRVKTFSCKRSELEEVATRAVFPDFDYALIAAISG